MIGIYFNESGYYIQGSRIERAWSCSLAVTETGTPIFSPTHHLCGVLYRVLRELETLQTTEDIIIYNDSRLIEEINGVVEPLDDTHEQWISVYRKELLPHIRSHVLFRKKSIEFVRQRVEAGQKRLIGSIDPAVHLENIRRKEHETEQRKERTLQRFKEDWTNGNR